MNIGISTSVIQRGKSGVAQYVLALVRALLAQNGTHRLTLFVLRKDLPLFAFAEGRAKIVTVPERFRSPVRDILWHQTELPQLARRYQLDVLHVPSYRRMLWRRPCPLVATIHDLAPFRVANKYDWKRMLYGRHVARRLAHRQHKIIAVSHNTRRDLLEFFDVPGERLSVIHNGIDHDRFAPGSRSDAKEFVGQRYDLRGPFFLYVARLEHPGKNHVRLIAAFNRFKTHTRSDWQLVFAGSDWHGAETIHHTVKHSPFQRDIRSLGFVEDIALPQLYRAASAFVYPSLYEGFGFPPLEAMACGCPVLSSTCGALEEVVGNAALVVEPTNLSDLERQLTCLASDPRLRETLSVRGLEWAKQFNWQRTAVQTLEVYGRAVESSQNQPATPLLATSAQQV